MPDRLDVGLPLFSLGTANQVPRMNSGATAPEWATISAVLDEWFGSQEGNLIHRGAVAWGTLSASTTNGAILRSNGGVTSVSYSTLSTIIDTAIGSTRGTILYRGAAGWAIRVPVASGRVLTDGGVGADPAWLAPAVVPSAATWGANARTISGNLTLTTSDDPVQSIHSDAGVERTVTLSDPTDTTSPYFIIYNRSTLLAATLNIADQEGNALVAPLAPGQGVTCYSDEARWAVFGPFSVSVGASVDVGYQVIAYSNDPGAVGSRLHVRGIANTAATSLADNVSGEEVVTEACVIDQAVVVYETNGNSTLEVRVNGVSVDDLVCSSGVATGGYFSKTVDLSRSLAAGDKVSVALKSETSTIGDVKVQLHLRTTAAGKGYSFHWSSTTPTAGQHAQADAASVTAPASLATLDYLTEHMVPLACTDVAFAWHSTSADATTVCKSVKNGVVQETFALTGVAGRIATAGTTSWASGDGCAIEFDAGTNPGAWHCSLGMNTQGVESLRFAGDGAAGTYIQSFGVPATAGAGTASQEHEIVLPYACQLEHYTWAGASGTTANFAVRKNGVVGETVSIGAAEQTSNLTQTVYGKGDRVGITSVGAAPAGRVGILIRPINES